MDFQEHANQHHHIREALVAALHERRPVDPAAMRSDRSCPTGCWIHGEGARRWAGNHAFLGLLEAHRAFHQQAGLIADQIHRGQWAEAQRSLRQGSPFAMAFSDLSAALRRMRATAETLAA
ncbi:CZB domain-containing protein [Caulobacter sp.]|uniref:CZB domain-containing protein n=1 Tax=Caulobacter sp. TaxID=78 RepID=UPI001B08AAC1|nr:CZB domain-containing protein [Caulobacter sp.]MBO9545792.1 CZB domain-containing protein [Caulobacter sp.]